MKLILIRCKKAGSKKKYKVLGIGILRKKGGRYCLKASYSVLQRGETESYRIRLNSRFAKEHYMEELELCTQERSWHLRMEESISFSF